MVDLEYNTVKYQNIRLIIGGYYTAEEPTVMYYSDGSGHPGSPSEFEIQYVYCDTQNIIELLTDEQLREIELLVLEKKENY